MKIVDPRIHYADYNTGTINRIPSRISYLIPDLVRQDVRDAYVEFTLQYLRFGDAVHEAESGKLYERSRRHVDRGHMSSKSANSS